MIATGYGRIQNAIINFCLAMKFEHCGITQGGNRKRHFTAGCFQESSTPLNPFQHIFFDKTRYGFPDGSDCDTVMSAQHRFSHQAPFISQDQTLINIRQHFSVKNFRKMRRHISDLKKYNSYKSFILFINYMQFLRKNKGQCKKNTDFFIMRSIALMKCEKGIRQMQIPCKQDKSKSAGFDSFPVHCPILEKISSFFRFRY